MRRTLAVVGRPIVWALAVQLAGCGGGGGGGGGGGSDDGNLTLIGAETFLSREADAPADADPRTAHKVAFRLSGLTDPGRRLTNDDVEVRRNGQVDVEARITLADDAIDKSDVTLILDISSSLTAEDLANVRASAKTFATTVLPIVDTLRIWEFASPTETRLVGTYQASGSPATGFTWTPSPLPDIDAIDGGSNSTALFHAVTKALGGDPEGDDILALFSDGRENSSPPGAREAALRGVENREVFSVGFGSVDPDELRALSQPPGEFIGVKASLDGLFDEIAERIQSGYTLVYDTPLSFGMPTLEVRIEAEQRRFRFETSLTVGIDLARAAIGRFPTVPGSRVVLRDFRTTPPTTIAYAVAPRERAVRRTDGFLAFAVEPTSACTSPSCRRRFQGVFGAGAQDETGKIYVGSLLEEGASWPDADTGDTLTFRGYSDQSFRDLDRRYRCAEVAFPGGTHFFAPEVGLVRTVAANGDVVVELAEAPCLATGFDEACK